MFRFNKAVLTKSTARIAADVSRLLKHHKLTPSLAINDAGSGVITTHMSDLGKIERGIVRNAFKSIVSNTARYPAERDADHFFFKDENGMYLFIHPMLADLDPAAVELRAVLIASCPADHYDELMEETNLRDIDVLMADNSYPFNMLVNDMKAVHSRIIQAAANLEMLVEHLNTIADTTDQNRHPSLVGLSISTRAPNPDLAKSLNRVFSSLSTFEKVPEFSGDLYLQYNARVEIVNGGKYWSKYPLVDADEYTWQKPVPVFINLSGPAASHPMFIHSIRIQPSQHPHNEELIITIKATHMSEEESQYFFPATAVEEIAPIAETVVAPAPEQLTVSKFFERIDAAVSGLSSTANAVNIEILGTTDDVLETTLLSVFTKLFNGGDSCVNDLDPYEAFNVCIPIDDATTLKDLTTSPQSCDITLKATSQVGPRVLTCRITSVTLSVTDGLLLVSCEGKKEFIKEEKVDHTKPAIELLESLSRALSFYPAHPLTFRAVPAAVIDPNHPHSSYVANFFNSAARDPSNSSAIAAWLATQHSPERRTLTLRVPRPSGYVESMFEAEIQAVVTFSNNSVHLVVDIDKVQLKFEQSFVYVIFTYATLCKNTPHETNQNKTASGFNPSPSVSQAFQFGIPQARSGFQPDMGLPVMPKNIETTKPIQTSMDRIRASKLYWDMLEEMFENEKVNDSSAKLANTAKKLDAFVLEILSLA